MRHLVKREAFGAAGSLLFLASPGSLEHYCSVPIEVENLLAGETMHMTHSLSLHAIEKCHFLTLDRGTEVH